MTNAKKILALTITMLMILSSVGTLALAAETVTTLDAVYVIKGQSYTLPTTIGEYTDIVWDSAVSTDYVGVQTITGTSGETPLSITVYVGEMTNKKVEEDFELFSENPTLQDVSIGQYSTIRDGVYNRLALIYFTQVIKDSETQEITDTIVDDFGVVTVDGNKAVKFGAKYSNWTSRIEQIKNVTKNAPHRFTFKYRMDLDAENVINNSTIGNLRVHDSTSTGSVFAHLYLKTNEDSTAISIQPERPSDSTYDRPVVKIADIDSATNSTGWMNFEFIFYADSTYDLYVDNTKVISGMGTYLTTVENSSPAGFTVQNYSYKDINATNTHYVDDMVIYGGNYVTGALPESIEANAYTGTDGEGEETVSLAMTSGTKDFAVKYAVPAADLTAGNTVTVQGSIDGFTQTIPVNVTVKASDSKNTTIKTSQNCPVTLPQTYNDLSITWDKTVDTSKVGTIIYNGTTAKDTGITCTVIVGDYTVKETDVTDAFEIGCVSTEATEQQQFKPSGTNGWLVVPEVDKSDVQVVTYDGDKAVKFGPNVVSYSAFIGLQSAAAFSDGTYKISADMKIADATVPTDSSSNIFNLRIRNVVEAANVLVYLNTDGTLSFRGYGQKAAQQDKEKNTDVKVTNGETPWFNITFLFYEDLTYDLFVNDQQITSRLPFYYEDTSKYTSLKFDRFIVSDQKDGISTQYVKNLEMSTYRYFDGTLPTAFEYTLGHNLPINETTTLTMSDNTEREFNVITGDIDGTKVGQFTTTGAIEGFDTPVTISARVCDYLIEKIASTSTGIDKVTIKKVGAATSGVAVFAYYGSDHKIAQVKSVPFADSDFTDGVAELNVGLEFPSDVSGGYVKGFIFNSLSGIMPLDTVFTPAS